MTASDKDVLDLRGTLCPLNFVRIKLELDKSGPRMPLRVVTDSGDTGRDILRSLRAQGFSVKEIVVSEDNLQFTVVLPAE